MHVVWSKNSVIGVAILLNYFFEWGYSFYDKLDQKNQQKLLFSKFLVLGPFFRPKQKTAQKMTTDFYSSFQSCTTSDLICLSWDIVFRVNWHNKINKITFFEVFGLGPFLLSNTKKRAQKIQHAFNCLSKVFNRQNYLFGVGYSFRLNRTKKLGILTGFRVFRFGPVFENIF